MATRFTITSEDSQRDPYRETANKGDIITYQFDLAPWAEANSTVTTVTWTVKTGQASPSGQALASNVASANISFSQAGGNLIEIKATNGTQTYIALLDVLVKDPERAVSDYGLCCG